MEPAILASIIGGIFVIAAALIPILIKKRRDSVDPKLKEYSIFWWRKHIGQEIRKEDISRAFSAIVGNQIKKYILLQVKYHKNKEIIGYLYGISTDASIGVSYCFADRQEENRHYVLFAEIKKIIVENVK